MIMLIRSDTKTRRLVNQKKKIRLLKSKWTSINRIESQAKIARSPFLKNLKCK